MAPLASDCRFAPDMHGLNQWFKYMACRAAQDGKGSQDCPCSTAAVPQPVDSYFGDLRLEGVVLVGGRDRCTVDSQESRSRESRYWKSLCLFFRDGGSLALGQKVGHSPSRKPLRFLNRDASAVAHPILQICWTFLRKSWTTNREIRLEVPKVVYCFAARVAASQEETKTTTHPFAAAVLLLANST